MHPIVHAAADLLLGASCPGCSAPGWGVCQECRAALLTPVREIQRDLPVPLIAACAYRPLLAHIIPRYKDDGALHLDRFLGGLLARSVEALGPPPDARLVAVPSLARVVRARGFDHAGRLAEVAARRAGLAVAPKALRRSDAGLDQRGLTRQERALNLHGSMLAADPGRPVVVVDDVATTGSSLREAIRALLAAGVTVLGAAVIADAQKPVDSPAESPPHASGWR